MELAKIQEKKIKIIAKKYRIKMILVFGSFANGKTHKESDLDIGISIMKKLTLDQDLSLIRELSVVFGQEVDLAVINHANPLLLHQIAMNSILIYGAKSAFDAFKLYAFHRYNDYAPFFKLEAELNKKIIKQYARR
jgi:uncharacterized protein